MKYLKRFESYSNKDIAQGIAEEIKPRLEEIRKEKGIFTKRMLDNFMEERGGSVSITTDVQNYLKRGGFEFDDSNENIAKSLVPDFEKIRDENGIFTIEDFEKFMDDNYDMELRDIDEMISILATLHDDRYTTEDGIEWKGFDYEDDSEDDIIFPTYNLN